MEVIHTERGAPCLIVGGFRYRRDRSHKQTITWRCCQGTCKARCKTDLAIQTIVKAATAHAHEKPDERTLEVERVRTSVKRKAVETFTEAAGSIVGVEAKKTSKLSHKDVRNLADVVYRARMKAIMPRKIPVDMAEELINAVKKRESLYNTRKPDYKNRHCFELAWKAVADEIHCDVATCKSTWASLRCTFNRNLLATRKSMASGEVKQPKWHFFQQMLFMKEHVSHGAMADNLDLEELLAAGPSQGDNNSSCSQEFFGLDTGNNTNTASSSSPRDTDTAGEAPPVEFIKDEAHHSDTEDHFTDASSVASNSDISDTPSRGQKRKVSAEEDPDLSFFKGLMPYFKKLSPMKKLKYIHHVTGVLMEFVYEHENE